jgi:ferredoxin
MPEQLQVDRIRCDGHGLCAELLPEVIALDDWGYPIIKVGSIAPPLLEHARQAVEACPVLALKLARRANDQGAVSGLIRPAASIRSQTG